MTDENSSSSEDENAPLSPDAKERLLKELKERLKEIERLKKELSGIGKQEGENEENDGKPEPFSFARVREEVEELRVPPLELLEDKPIPKKKKIGEEST